MKIKNICLLVCLLSALKSFSQVKVSNEKSENHLLINGTGVFIVPPPGFEKGINFIGYQDNNSGSSIIVNELPAPYKQVKDGFSKENMSKKGMEFLNAEEYLINNSPAVMMNSQQFSVAHGYSFFKSTLILKLNNSKTLLINSNVPEEQKERMMNLIKISLLSVFNDSSIEVNAFSSLDFSVDLSKSSFKHTKSISGSLMLEGPKKEFLIIAKSIRPLSASDKKGSSINALKAITSIEYVGLIHSKEITQDGMSGYQITANIVVKDQRRPMKAVQSILFSDNSYYTFVTIVNPAEQDLIKDFEYILTSFKRK
ncbi:hypothetical protein [Flavitalea sp.]|nr:hypothetical protein [Flavitalea sp.]